MKKTFRYLGSIIEIDVKLNAHAEEFRIYSPRPGAEEVKLSLPLLDPVGQFVRKEFDYQHHVSATINGEHAAGGLYKTEQLKTAIEKLTESLKRRVEQGQKTPQPEHILEDLGFVEPVGA